MGKTTILFYSDHLDAPDNNKDRKIILYKDIVYIMYENPYSVLTYYEGVDLKTLRLRASLNDFETNFKMFLQDSFCEINRQTIVKREYIDKYQLTKKNIYMKDGKVFDISRRNVSRFEEYMRK